MIGKTLSHYEIVEKIGEGGMGEVYRARDTRLARDVALKTLPSSFAKDPDRKARFEREARAVAALSHPGVLAIHDIDVEGDPSYVVFELVEGMTLRERLVDGPLSPARAVPLAAQIAHALAAAHDRGVIHRDLKPENVMVTRDGRGKILDFGLARVVESGEAAADGVQPTQPLPTEPGMVLGTIGYMSPEQVRGQVADPRSDIFALGAILHEMLTGRRAFHAGSPAETMSAILHDDPPELRELVPDVSPVLERIVARCLEKEPIRRFRSAADLAFALETITTTSSSGAHAALARASGEPPTFERLTFRNGHVAGARFTPDGASVVYGAAWDGKPHEVFMSRTGSPESRSLGLPPGCLLSISSRGEMAISLDYHYPLWFQSAGTLARAPLAGGGMRPVQKDVGHADWSPDGATMAVIRYLEGRCRLEYPAGNVLVEVGGWLGFCRFSPDGRHVAFSRHTHTGEGAADLCVVTASGEVRVLVQRATNLNGIAWSPGGDEIWWSGINADQHHGIWGVTLDGSEREIHRSPSRITLHDIRSDGGVLITIDDLRTGLAVGRDDDTPEIDLSWFDGSIAADLTPDGEQVLFLEAHEAENPHYACYLRPLDGSPAVRLGSGSFSRLSADGQWVVTVLNEPSNAIALYPTGFGEPRQLRFEELERVAWAAFHPDGERLFVVGSAPGQPTRVYVAALADGNLCVLYDEEIAFEPQVGLPISPDGERIVIPRVNGEHVMFHVGEKREEPLTGLGPGQKPLRFEAGGNGLFLVGSGSSAVELERLDLISGERTPWRRLEPPHPTGLIYRTRPTVLADGSRYAYSFLRAISNLYFVDGLV